MPTPLAEKLRQRIAISGPITIADFMTACLLDPDHGYYTHQQPFGTKGDFITAPEVSQMFGEIIGAWLIHQWHELGCPAPFSLAELGPGRGTLMRDILRVATLDDAFNQAAKIQLIEASPRLRAIQAQTLGPWAQRVGWHDDFEHVPPQPLLIVSNEFFDALPIRQFVKAQGQWRERMVGLDDAGALVFTIGEAALAAIELPPGHAQAEDGDIYERAPTREAMAGMIANHLSDYGGAALHIDYGHTKTAIGDTLQAVKNHAFTQILSTAGEADLTSHVDFEALAKASTAPGISVTPVMTQSAFLLANGLLERAGRLGANQSTAKQDEIRAAVQRLAGNGPDDMGDLFKVIIINARLTH